VTWELFSRVKAGIPVLVKHLPGLTRTRGASTRPDVWVGSGRRAGTGVPADPYYTPTLKTGDSVASPTEAYSTQRHASS